MNLKTKFGFGMGHVLNDLCASMWFTYTLVFFSKVIYLDNTYSGVILLVGQLADGVSTTFVGLMSDKPDNIWLCRKYGRRKSWHLVGVICVILSFPFIFHSCLGCSDADEWAQVIYFSAFALIFQFGWASCQISHLALIPALAQDPLDRTGLTAIRYSMTVASNIIVYLVALGFFGFNSSDEKLCTKDEDNFMYITLIVIGLGAFCSLLFHLLVKEEVDPPFDGIEEERRTSGEEERESDKAVTNSPPVPILYWFKVPAFYGVAVLYMSTRLFVNLSQAYIPLYIQESLELSTIYIAIIPLVMFVAGFFVSLFMKLLNRLLGSKEIYLIGAVIGLIACIVTFTASGKNVTTDTFRHVGIFFVAALYGASASIILVTSLSLTAELIGEHSSSAAFVYGAMSFTDKVSNGVAVVLIQKFTPCDKCIEEAFKWYYRDVLFYVVGGAVLIGALTAVALRFMKNSKDIAVPVPAVHQDENGEPTSRTPLLSDRHDSYS
eukprot:TRINITY_DN36317_c0_g1_i6.p1 TRINITY_DN36317_c0_g1~~TRINITY_DN36317_c0_g1_i6.p1  ORF type:complete len:503 (-),score=44.66 TRINITY_DN36317_c0_g1_i6:227-1705(-)